VTVRDRDRPLWRARNGHAPAGHGTPDFLLANHADHSRYRRWTARACVRTWPLSTLDHRG